VALGHWSKTQEGTVARYVKLASIPAGETFHQPELGYEGTVIHHGPGSSTVQVTRYAFHRSFRTVKGDKKDGSDDRMVEQTSFRYDTERTQWSLGTDVAPGPMPVFLKEQVEEDVRLRNGFRPERGVVVPASAPAPAEPKPAPTRGRARAPQGGEQAISRPAPAAVAQAVTQEWPTDVEVPGRLLDHLTNDKKAMKRLAKGGLTVAAVRKAGAGTTVKWNAATPAATALLLDELLAKWGTAKGGAPREYWRIVRDLGQKGVTVALRDAAGRTLHVVAGEVAA
jgi:hypothetical protein